MKFKQGRDKPNNFFEKHSGLWGFLSFVLAVSIFIGGFFVGKEYQVRVIQNGAGPKITLLNNGSGVIETKTIANEINGDVNYGDVINQPTKVDEQKAQMQLDAKTNLEAFFRRRERGDIENAYKQLDRQLANDGLFQTGALFAFKNTYLRGGFYLDDLQPQGDCQSSNFVDRCEFNFTLRYVNQVLDKSIAEKRHVEMVVNKDEFDFFKVGLLKCVDRNCENNPLFGTGM